MAVFGAAREHQQVLGCSNGLGQGYVVGGVGIGVVGGLRRGWGTRGGVAVARDGVQGAQLLEYSQDGTTFYVASWPMQGLRAGRANVLFYTLVCYLRLLARKKHTYGMRFISPL